MLAFDKQPIVGLGSDILQACYYSKSAAEAWKRLDLLQTKVGRAWKNYNAHSLGDYLELGTMPFTFTTDQNSAHEALMNNTEKIIFNDLAGNKRFNISTDSIARIKQLLVILADSNPTPNLDTLSSALGIGAKNVLEILKALVQAELLIRIPSYGGDMAMTRKPVQYKFMSAAIRHTHCHLTGKQQTTMGRKGPLLEDNAALHYYKEFIRQGRGSLTYPYAKKDPGYCDFILRIINSHQIAIEFGLGQKSINQIRTTFRNKKLRCDYGIVFSESPLRLHPEDNVIQIPLKYFLLM